MIKPPNMSAGEYYVCTNSTSFPHTELKVTWMGKTLTRRLENNVYRPEEIEPIAEQMIREIKASYGI